MEKKKNNSKRIKLRIKKALNISWKVALIMIGILASIIIYVLVREQYRSHYGKCSHDYDHELSEKIYVHSFDRNKVKLYDIEREEYISPGFRWVSCASCRDTLTVFCNQEGKRGFLNIYTGEIVLEAKYSHAWIFSEGLAAVVEPDGKMGFIDHSGKYVIEPEIEYMSEHDYTFKHGVCCIENKSGKQGLLNKDGLWVLPQEYNRINYVQETDMFIICKDEKYGVVKNNSFESMYPIEYDAIDWVDTPSGKGFMLYKDYCLYQVAVDGTMLNNFIVDETRELKYVTDYISEDSLTYDISDKVICFEVCNLCGVMDKHTGEVLIPAKYGDISMVSKNIIKCGLEDCYPDNYVLYDLYGNKIE